ncbi:MAG: glycerol-3-phosphate 1-O-acyltransferase PlsY [Bryobacteraceae bacterium]
MHGVLVLLASYLIGGIPFGYLLVRLKSGSDVRTLGSGNIGATNVFRTTGKTFGIATLLLDVLKGACAVWLAGRYTGASPLWMSLAAIAVMSGHAFPIFLKFHGGKAVATFIGAFLYLTPVPLLTILFLFVLIVAVTRYISLGSIIASGLFPLAVFLIDHPTRSIQLASLIAGLFIVYRHRVNIERIRAGTENVFSWRRRPRSASR